MEKKKGLTKEIIIFLLLAILIILVMAVALYDFIPANVAIPDTITYGADAETTSIKQEIAYTNGGDLTGTASDEELVTSLKSYSIEASDLTVYSQKNLYNSGNSNPFDEYVEEEKTESSGTTNTNTQTTNQTTSSASNTTTNSTTNTTTNSTTGTFFEKPTSK